MSASTRLGFPLIASGQSQKEVTHNEALQLIDMLVAACVEDVPSSVPPSTPEIGHCYLIAPAAEGSWTGRSGCLACYTSGGWRFVPPREGMTVLVRTSDVMAHYRGTSWDVGTTVCSKIMVAGQQVVGARGAPISAPVGGLTVDTECREALTSVLSAIRQHGLIAT